MSFILNHFSKTLSLLLHVSIAYRTQIQDTLPQQYYNEKVRILTRGFS